MDNLGGAHGYKVSSSSSGRRRRPKESASIPKLSYSLGPRGLVCESVYDFDQTLFQLLNVITVKKLMFNFTPPVYFCDLISQLHSSHA